MKAARRTTTPAWALRAKHPLRGYTIVELMMALTVLAIGVTGVAAMQKITVAANRHAKNLALASHIAQAWQEQLTADAVMWNHPSQFNPTPDLDDTVWLKEVRENEGTWLRPTNDAIDVPKFGPTFDALGNFTTSLNRTQFCTHVRLIWLFQPDQPVLGNGLIRAEVRVFWPRENRSFGDQHFCSQNADPTTIGQSPDTYHFVYKTSAIRQNTP